jgi:hypothetical protein
MSLPSGLRHFKAFSSVLTGNRPGQIEREKLLENNAVIELIRGGDSSRHSPSRWLL